MALELTTLAIVKNIMEMPVSVTKHDATLTGLIRGVSADFQRLSGRLVNQVAQTEIVDVLESTRRLLLKAWPVKSSPTIQIFHDVDRAFGATTEIDSDLYYLDLEEGIVDLFQRFNDGKKVIKILYTGGMATLTGPEIGLEFWTLFPDIAEAVQFEVIREFKLKDNLGAAAIKIAEHSTTIMSDKQRSKLFWRMVNAYGRVTV